MEKQQNFSELSDPEWQQDLGFLSDITSHLNKLNLKLQGSHFVTALYSAVNAFRTKLTLFQSMIVTGNLKYFPDLNEAM